VIVLGLDPGSSESALVDWDSDTRRPRDACKIENGLMAGVLNRRASLERDCRVLVIEQTKGYTLPIGAGANARSFFPQQVLDTCEWTGFFRRCWEELGGQVEKLDRRSVKLHLLGRANGTDSLVRAALLDLVGPQGTKRAPGPTFGLRSDLWAALAVAYVWTELARRPNVAAPVRAPGANVFGRESHAAGAAVDPPLDPRPRPETQTYALESTPAGARRTS